MAPLNAKDIEKLTPPSFASTQVAAVSEEPPKASPPPFPEGGLQGWLTLIGSYTNAFGVYQDFYIREYLNHFTPEKIGWIGGIQLFLVFSMGLMTGPLFDRGYFVLLHALALFTLSVTQANQYYQIILSQGVCFGLASGLTYVPTLTVVSHYFQRRRPLAMGVVAAGSALGAVLHPIMLNKLFNNPRIGFHIGVRISAALNVFLLIIACLITRTRLPPQKDKRPPPIGSFFRDTPYAIFILGMVLVFFGLFFPIFYIQIDSITHNVDRELSFYALSILNAASIFGRTVPSLFAPKLGVFNLFLFFTLGSGIILLCMIALKDAVGVVLLSVFYGFFSGAGTITLIRSIGSFARSLDELGARIGVVFAFCGKATYCIPITGALLGSQLHWTRAILFAGITLIASIVILLIPRYILGRRRNTQKV
ncbi:hypothetical protein AMATHDRAFT_195751 [Amanita thiersii Skay4041]|uniref:Major facilitator superfamily (MFS) profile domain-containing protein n=1 Tax=Amanita thiersii Skay4041 TaxID=703135 RepID=A0A2A9NL02_9AGAR|nr:hypothetical protein AMATHDRAFT_195751 [Amanita thiersii Skay4041]